VTREIPRDPREAADRMIARVLLAIAFSAVSVLLLLTLFIFREGLPIFLKTGVGNFLLGMKWAPAKGVFGILPMIAGSVWVTAGALILGVPFGLACALFLAEVAPPRVSRQIKPAIELLAAIPSVVYGFIGLVVLVPLVRQVFGGPGFSVLASSVVLAIMILPTVISISYDALKAVPVSYREGSLALGASRWQTMRMVLLPAARSGIMAGIILGMGRAVGETMAVIMVAGNAIIVPGSPLDPVRTLTSNIALEMGYAAGDHQQALFATGIVLFVIIMALNLAAARLGGARFRRARSRARLGGGPS
jgi:phosphate transport system permease protein